jgi:hypothetical protein
VATRISNQLPNEGNSAAFREFGWRFTNGAGLVRHGPMAQLLLQPPLHGQ